MAEYLSQHFTLEELIYSDTAKAKNISNKPTTTHKNTLKHTCQYLLEKIRALLNEKYKEYKGKKVKQVSLRVTSGYRSAALNVAIPGSASTSQHCKGEAADVEAVLVLMDGTNEILPFNVLYEDIKRWVRENRLSVDQCIQERSGKVVWVHVSLKDQIKDSRGQFLKYNNGMYVMDCILK